MLVYKRPRSIQTLLYVSIIVVRQFILIMLLWYIVKVLILIIALKAQVF
jgi:hypothetical protein